VNYVAWLKRFHPEHLPSLGMCICCIFEYDHPIILLLQSSNDDCLHVEALCDLDGTPQSLGSQEGADEPSHSQPQSTSLTPNNTNQENSPDATPNRNHSNAKPGCSLLSKSLVHPTSSNDQKSQSKSYFARFLTSNVSIALLEEKRHKKLKKRKRRNGRRKKEN